MDLITQRSFIESAIRSLEAVIQKAEHEKAVLTRAFNALGEGQDIYNGNDILSQETKKIMYNLSK